MVSVTLEEELRSCPECGGNTTVDRHKGEVVCRDCGLVLVEDMTDPGQEWREFDPIDVSTKRRVGPPNHPQQKSKTLSTRVGKKNKDAYGRRVNPRLASVLRKTQGRINRYYEREGNRARAANKVIRICAAQNIRKSTMQDAIKLCSLAAEEKLTKGRELDVSATAAVYAACRMNGVPCTLDSIADTAGKDRNKVGNFYRVLSKEFDLDTTYQFPENYVGKFCEGLELKVEKTQNITDKSNYILEETRKSNLASGKNPIGLAAAAIYLASEGLGYGITQKEISEVSGVTPVTIRNRYKEMEEELSLDEVFPTC